ncbi:unnamed protein product [Rangifer tarandus platyrhynchus]|uniref:Uncharacterized protein n=1 Tax=Rangifer tarandus platyrhynchus TaxID=3082113 RepID=A0ABN9A4R5_RANTA|nr:unnamed protein product [Rangifer tarandus platyrhynchus]
MQPPWESPALARVAAVMVADGALRRSPSPREPRLRDLPALLRSGLILRRKRGAAGGQMEPLSRSREMDHRIMQRMSRIAKRNRATKMALVTGATRACMVSPRGRRGLLKEGQ